MQMEQKKLKLGKMMNIKNIIFLFILLFGMQFGVFSQKNISKKLMGKWNWIETSGGFGGYIVTPKTEGYSIQMEFTKKGEFKSFKDNIFNLEMKYKVELGKTIYSTEKKFIIQYIGANGANNGMINDSFAFRDKDTLVLMQECTDCYTRVFVKMKK